MTSRLPPKPSRSRAAALDLLLTSKVIRAALVTVGAVLAVELAAHLLTGFLLF